MTMGANLELIRATYEGSSEDNGRNLLAALAPDATWTEAEGFPYAGTYVGPEAIVTGVFQRLGTEWIDVILPKFSVIVTRRPK
jgi:uncharacterized protein